MNSSNCCRAGSINTERRTLLAAGAALLAAPLVSRAAARVPRVVTLEYHATEMVLALGLRPVGVADPRGYARWVGVGRDGLQAAANVGTRQQPSLEHIAALRPDLIVAVDFRHATLLPLLQRIAPTLLLASPLGDGLAAVRHDLRQTAAHCDRGAACAALLQALDGTLAQTRTRLAGAGWQGRQLSVLQSIAGVPQLWAFTGNSVPGGVQRALGLAGPWLAQDSRQGVETRTVEDLLTLPGSIALLGDGRAGATRSALWAQLPAVKSGRLATLPPGLWPFGGPLSTQRLVAALGEGLLRLGGA